MSNPKRAAIYARRSTEEHQAESLETQTDNARRFINAQGWTHDAAHLFIDSGVSRAEFVKRRGLIALLAAADRGSFNVVVMRDETRLGGDMLRVGLVIQDLADAGIQIVFYISGEVVRCDDATSKLVMAARNFSSELEREKTSCRTRENLERKARRGLVAGGTTFGYRNITSPDGGGRVRQIDAKQAAIIVEMYERYAAGEGLRAIAKTLNARDVPSPRAGGRGLGSWVPSVVHAMLRRPLYAGRVEWGHVTKTYRGGTKTRTRVHDRGLVVVADPELRIVPHDLWERVVARCALSAHRKSPGPPPVYLLTGVLRCGACGGPLTVANGKSSTDGIKVYTCARRRDRGNVVCRSTLRRDVRAVDAAVLEWVRETILDVTVVRAALAGVRMVYLEMATASDGDEKRLDAEARTLRAQVGRLAEALSNAPSDAALVIVETLSAKRGRLNAIDVERRKRVLPAALDLHLRRVERDALARLADLRSLAQDNAVEARRLMATIFRDGLTASLLETADGNRFRLRGTAIAEFDLFVGSFPAGKSASPAGPETLPVLPPQRFEADLAA